MSSVPTVPTTGAAPINPGIIAGSAVAVIVVAAILAMLFVGAEGHFGPKVTEGEEGGPQTTKTMAEWLKAFREGWLNNHELADTILKSDKETRQKINAQLNKLGFTYKLITVKSDATATTTVEGQEGDNSPQDVETTAQPLLTQPNEAAPINPESRDEVKITEAILGRFALLFKGADAIKTLDAEVRTEIEDILNSVQSEEIVTQPGPATGAGSSTNANSNEDASENDSVAENSAAASSPGK